MKSVQRKFGTMMKRSESEGDVNTVMAEFKAVDEMLDSLIKDLKAWRTAWEDILKYQYDTTEAFATIYKPIEGTGEGATETQHQAAQTPAKYMQKCLGLQKEYSDEKTDLGAELAMISTKLLHPAEQAKQHTKLLHKTLKHRDNMKLDYERYSSRAEHARKKETRSAKDEQTLQTCEANLAQSRIDYQTADEQVKQTFPHVTAAVLSLLPHLLAQQVQIQTTLVGQMYTVLDAYSKKFGFPNPAPNDADIIAVWDQEFTSLRKELEGGISLLAGGKAVHMNMNLPPEKDKSTMSGYGIRNKVMNRNEKPTPKPAGATGSNQLSATQSTEQLRIEGSGEELAPTKPPRPSAPPMPSPSINMSSKPRMASNPTIPTYRTYSNEQPPPPYDQKPTALIPGYPDSPGPLNGGTTPPSRYQTPINGAVPTPFAKSPGNPYAASNTGSDYFGNNRRPSQASSIASSLASEAAAKKKKPPPPVPAKRIPSTPQAQYVTAVYDFEGQSTGDLAFREGDRIKVVKKTDNQDDWWDGELNGRVGVFPANYVQL